MSKFSRQAKCLLVLLLLCLLENPAWAETYFCKIGGSNSADGLSWANAWAHPNKSNDNINDGDTLVIGPGEYDTVFVNPPDGAAPWTVYRCAANNPDDPDSGWPATIVRGSFIASGWTQRGSSNTYALSVTLPPRWCTEQAYSITVTQDDSLCQSFATTGGYTASIVSQAGRAFYDDTGTDSLIFWPYGGGDPDAYEVRVSQQAVFRINSASEGAIKIIGLTIQDATRAAVWIAGQAFGGSGDAPDSIWIYNCRIKNVADAIGNNNTGAIVFGFSLDPAMIADAYSRFCYVRRCTITDVISPSANINYSGGAAIDAYGCRDVTIDSCFFQDLPGGGVVFKFGGSTGASLSENNVIAFNRINRCYSGIWFGNKQWNLWIYGNIIENCTYRGIDIHSTGANGPFGGANIRNNTFVNAAGAGGEAITISPTATNALNRIKWNIIFDTATVQRQIGFVDQSEAPAQTGIVDSFEIDGNMYFTGASAFACRFYGTAGCSGTDWAAWQSCGFDANGTSNVNPNFAASHLGDYSRLNSSAEIDTTYGGRTWTRYGAWQPTPNQHSPNWHDIDQIWHDTYGGLVNAANGFAAGDTLNFIENVYCRNKKWGLVVQVPVLILGNGYALHPDSVALNTIANNSFETPDVDPTRAASWDFTDAPNISRMFGHYHVVTELTDEPSLWEGDYALRVQLPCATQTVKTASSYQFAPKTHHAIEFAYLNVADANVRVTVGLLNTNGDTAYSAKNNVGMMERGSEPVWVHFMTKDTVETYKIFIQITGGDAATSSNQVFFDHVLHTTFRNFGIALEPDTCTLDLDWMDNQRFYNPATGLMETDPGLCFSSTASNREFWGLGVQGGVAEGTMIRDLRIEPIQPSLFFRGIYGAYGCSDITIKKATIKPMGSNPMGVMTWNGVRWDIDSTDVIFPEEPLDYHYSKRESVPSVGFNLRADKNNYGYSSKVSYCKVYNYPYQGVYITTRRDMTSDHVLQYPQNIVEYCEFYPRTLITNGFAIEDYGNAASIIRYNKIFGSGQYHGTGIHVTTKQVDVDSLQWSIVEGNVGTVESYPYNQEYPYGNLAYGFQHEGVPLCSLRYNYLTALAIDPAAPAVDGMRITRSGSFKLFMHDNTFRGLSTGHVTGAALHLYSPTWSFDPAADVFDCYHNSFITNGVALRSVGVNSVGLQFKDCFFDYLDTLTAPNWKKMKSGENAYLPARDLRFIDNRYGDVEADSAFEQTMMFGAYNYLSTADNGTEWFLSWTTTINSQGPGGPQEGDSVFIITAQVDTVFKGATDAAGQLITVVDQFRDSAATTTYNQNVDRTAFSPYTIRVRHSGFELEQQATIDQKTTLNFNFSTDYSGLFKRKKRILE